MRIKFSLFATLLVSLSFGCSNAPQNASTTDEQPTTTNLADSTLPDFTPLRPSQPYEDPREAVRDFLTAVSSGQNEAATALLTAKSQQELWSNGLEVENTGLPGSTFEVSAMEQVSETEAHVETKWVDENQNSYPCVWLLRKETHGWAIFGMATKYLPHKPAVLLPFEDQQELARRKQQAGRILQEYERQQMAAAQQEDSAGVGLVQPASASFSNFEDNGSGTHRVQQASQNVQFK